MHCIFKSEIVAGIAGEPESDSAGAKALSRCPEDMAVIYTIGVWWQGVVSHRPYWDNMPLLPEEVCERDNDSPRVRICR